MREFTLHDILKARFKILQHRIPVEGMEVHPDTYKDVLTQVPECKSATGRKYLGKYVAILFGKNG